VHVGLRGHCRFSFGSFGMVVSDATECDLLVSEGETKLLAVLILSNCIHFSKQLQALQF